MGSLMGVRVGMFDDGIPNVFMVRSLAMSCRVADSTFWSTEEVIVCRILTLTKYSKQKSSKNSENDGLKEFKQVLQFKSF